MIDAKLPVYATLLLIVSGNVSAETMCADAAQKEIVRAYFTDNPGTQPAIAAIRLRLPEALVVSALDESQAAATSADAFPEIWTAMTEWKVATFMIMKGASVFEILSGVGKGTPSSRSQYFNIEYSEPLRGHLRPDQYASIYAVAIPIKDDVVARGVIFYAANGASVFAAFISGESMEATPEEIAKFDAVMALVRNGPGVCP